MTDAVEKELSVESLSNIDSRPRGSRLHYVVVSVGGWTEKGRPMPSLIPDFATLEKRLADLPVVKHRAREVVLTAGSKTGELLFLKSGTIEVVKDGVQIASVNAPGSVFGEQSVLLDQPHTADVRTLELSEFYVADASAILARDPTVALYVAAILARRLDAANRWLVAVKRQVQTGPA